MQRCPKQPNATALESSVTMQKLSRPCNAYSLGFYKALKLNGTFMSLSSTSCLAAFLGSFQRHGIPSNQSKLGQKLPLSFLSFPFTYLCPYAFSHIHVIHAVGQINGYCSWFLSSHLCNFLDSGHCLMYWDLGQIISKPRELQWPSASNKGHLLA